jgi:hypothetical protein
MTTATFDAASGTLTVTLRVADRPSLMESQFLFTNTLTTSGMNDTGFTERRLFGRVGLPAEVTSALGVPEVKVIANGKAVATSRAIVRHEVWGGRRVACFQVESADRALAAPGAVATFTFAAKR